MAWDDILKQIPPEITAKNLSIADYMRSLGKDKAMEILKTLTPEEAADLEYDWRFWARPNQLPPKGDWTYLILCSGRGSGKTRQGSEFIKYNVEHEGHRHIALVGATAADVRDIMITGESGILSVYKPEDRPLYEPSKRRLTWKNGAVAMAFSAEEPDRTRGYQNSLAWCDELASWQYVQETWDNIQFGLRLGKKPRCIITTTPKPLALLKELIADKENSVVVRGSTYENKANLAESFYKNIIKKYEGTQLGRQEIHGEILDENEDAIFKKSWFKLWPADEAFPKFHYIIQSYDCAFTEKTTGDATACTTWGVFYPGEEVEHNSSKFAVMLLDCWGERLSFPDLRAKAIEEYQMCYGPEDKQVDVVLIEDKGSGISLRQELIKAGVPVRPYNPGKADKVQRAHAVSHLAYNGLVYIPESTKKPGEFRKWAIEFADQLLNFPMEGLHDDFVDSTTQALKLLSDMTWLQLDDIAPEIESEDDYVEPPPRVNPYAI